MYVRRDSRRVHMSFVCRHWQQIRIFQHQGIGTKFLGELIDEVRKNEEIKRIELYAEADNEIALKFYKKFGFQIEGCLKKYFKRAGSNQFIDEFVSSIVF